MKESQNKPVGVSEGVFIFPTDITVISSKIRNCRSLELLAVVSAWIIFLLETFDVASNVTSKFVTKLPEENPRKLIARKSGNIFIKKGWKILVSSKMRARVLGLVKSARSEIYCLFLSLVVTENVIGGFSENMNRTRQLACSNINAWAMNFRKQRTHY